MASSSQSADIKVLDRLPECCRNAVEELGAKGGLAKDAKKLFKPPVDLDLLTKGKFDKSLRAVEALNGKLIVPASGSLEAVKLETCRQIACAHYKIHDTSSKREQQTLATWWGHMASALATKCARAHGQDCSGIGGEWAEGPSLSHPWFEFVGVPNDNDFFYVDFVPYGVKVYLRFRVGANIEGMLRCHCGKGPNHGWEEGRRFSFPLFKTVDVPVKYNIWKILVRLVPKLGQAYAVADLLIKANKIKNALTNIERVSWAFEPALRVVRESATRVCEGRFDKGQLLNHIAEIVLDELND